MLTLASSGSRRARGILDPSILLSHHLKVELDVGEHSFVQLRQQCHCFHWEQAVHRISDTLSFNLTAVPEQHLVACHHFSPKDTKAQSHVPCDLETSICHNFFGKKSLDPEVIREGSSQTGFVKSTLTV